jgi:uncharacterized protein (TIGR03086 family)
VTTGDADLAALETVTDVLADALTDIDHAEWAMPTPCAEWTLRHLVDHVTGGNWYSVRILAGDTSDDALAATMARFGDEPVSAAAAINSAFDQRSAFERAGVLDRTWQHVAGELSGRQILRLRLHDLIVHSWDINEARRPPSSIPTSLAEWGLGELAEPGSLMSRHFDIPPAPNDGPPPGDASSAYLRAFGRS